MNTYLMKAEYSITLLLKTLYIFNLCNIKRKEERYIIVFHHQVSNQKKELKT